MNDSQREQKGLPPRRYGILTLFLVGMAVLIVVSTVSLWTGLGSSNILDHQQEQGELTACAREIAAEYEDKRDDLLVAQGVEAYRAAQLAFVQFRKGPDGRNETRAQRTVRVCE